MLSHAKLAVVLSAAVAVKATTSQDISSVTTESKTISIDTPTSLPYTVSTISAPSNDYTILPPITSTHFETITHPSYTTAPAACPTVTETASICSTCVQPLCLVMSTLTKGCECAGELEQVATVTVSFPCEEGKCPAGCPTSWKVVTASDCTATTSESASVSTTPTASGNGTATGTTPPGTTTSAPVPAGAGRVVGLSVGGAIALVGAVLLL